MFERNLNFILLLGQALNCLSWAIRTLFFQGLRACSHGSGGPRRGEVRYRTCTSPIRGKEILVFACNPRVTGWGPKCNHLVAKHAHKQRTIICSDEAAFRFNVVVAGKTIVWFSWLAWLSNSTPKLLPALSISSVLWQFWRWNRRNKSPCSRDLITPVRRVTPLPELSHGENLPHRSGLPRQANLGNPPWWGTPPDMWMRSRKKEKLYG